MDANYSPLTEKIQLSHKALKFKFGDRARITKYNNIFSKGYTENWSGQIFVMNYLLKTNPWIFISELLSGTR